MNESQWMEDPRVAAIPKEKLDFLQKIFFESKKLSQKELIPFFMALASRAKKANISFSQAETDIILEVIRENASPEECKKIDQTLKLFAGRK